MDLVQITTSKIMDLIQSVPFEDHRVTTDNKMSSVKPSPVIAATEVTLLLMSVSLKRHNTDVLGFVHTIYTRESVVQLNCVFYKATART